MEAGQEMLLAEVLSPSQVSQFLNCPAKWMFRYLLDLKEPSTAATALGRAFHETIAHNFRQKAKTAHALPVAECPHAFSSPEGLRSGDAPTRPDAADQSERKSYASFFSDGRDSALALNHFSVPVTRSIASSRSVTT